MTLIFLGSVTSGLVKIGTVVDNTFSFWTAFQTKVQLGLGVIIVIHNMAGHYFEVS